MKVANVGDGKDDFTVLAVECIFVIWDWDLRLSLYDLNESLVTYVTGVTKMQRHDTRH